MNPTDITYKSLNAAYNFFNEKLFDNKLSGCLITMQRKGKAFGYFSPEGFETRGEQATLIHEIALNPTYFRKRTDEQILSTLLHEMVHLWQQENGNPSRKGYHNREWAEKMEELGLISSNTGEAGGRRTGQSMSHYIEEGGEFDKIIGTFLRVYGSLSYQDVEHIKVKSKKTKVKYVCLTCGLKAWGKPNVNIKCGEDDEQMEAEETE